MAEQQQQFNINRNSKDYFGHKKKINDFTKNKKDDCGSLDSPAVPDTVSGSDVALTGTENDQTTVLIQAYLIIMNVIILQSQAFATEALSQLRVGNMSDAFKAKLHMRLGKSRKVIWSIVRELKSIDKRESNEATAEWSFLFKTKGAAKEKRCNDYRSVVVNLLKQGIHLQRTMEVIFVLTAVKKRPAN